jgi:alpha-ketoglutarate-dependent taurine dioxygenase
MSFSSSSTTTIILLSSIKQLSPTLLSITWQDGLESPFHASWLAHNCSCSSCRQISSGQRLATRPDPSAGAKILSAEIISSTNSIQIIFQNHVGNMDGFWLRQHCYSNQILQAEKKRRRALVEKLQICTFDYTTLTTPRDWMKTVARRGLCVIKNVPPNENELLRFVKTSGCEPSHVELYGTTFHVVTTPDPINIAYSSEGLAPHQDLAYYESPPGIQILHCLKFDDCISGGESTFVDAHAAAEILRQKNPSAFKALCEIPATFQKDHVHRDHPAKLYFCRPHIIVEPLEQDVISVFWAPPFEGPLRVPPHLVDTYYRAYEAFEEIINSQELWRDYGFVFKMKPGDLVVFNNRRMLHGRAAFSKNGDRHLHGCYLELDSFLNKIRIDRYLSLKKLAVDTSKILQEEMGDDEEWQVAENRLKSTSTSTSLRAGWFGEWRMGNQSFL